MGAYFKDQLLSLKKRHASVVDVRGMGLMIGIELVTDRASKTPAKQQAGAIRAYSRESGVLIGVGGQDGNVLRIQPPLTISQPELERTLEVIGEGLSRQG